MSLPLAVPETGRAECDERKHICDMCGKSWGIYIDVCWSYSGSTGHIIEKTFST